ncbi:hypothetical protein [Luteolibacter marinus]|uniref:hypothetical protein n=1 Tax=Luteolibacter marinus TaxID=2776705 RepID=UPI001868E8CC|nr:hypothetical protein [Luteolibacter marinus]
MIPPAPSFAIFAVIGFLSMLRGASPSIDAAPPRVPEAQASHFFLGSGDGTVIARNPGQKWNARFDGRGFTVEPDHGEWTWGLELATGPGPAAGMHREAGKLSYVRGGGLTEWFVNDRRGLEQGWTFASRPEGARRLRVSLVVRGGLAPAVSRDGCSIAFRNRSGAVAVTYGGLKAWDADGVILPARFCRVARSGFEVVVDDRLARYPVTIDPVAQQAYVKASNTGIGDAFGTTVAVSGDTMVVGAPGESSNATGVNGYPYNNLHLNSGAAYVFVRDGGTWVQQAYLKASNNGAQDQFGWSVAIDGDTVVVGALLEDGAATTVDGDGSGNSALNAGAAYVFVREDGEWGQQAYLKADNAKAGQLFGSAVAISGDRIVVGANRESSQAAGINEYGFDSLAPNAGAAYVFVREDGEWSQEAYLKASDCAANAEFGGAVAISGDRVVVGAAVAQASAGAAYVYVRESAGWSEEARLSASNAAANARFGCAVAVSGEILAIGARGEASSATGVNGNQDDTSSTDGGAVYMFSRTGGIWLQEAYLKASNAGAGDYFGKSLSLDGARLVVGAPGEDSSSVGVDGPEGSDVSASAGAAYVFSRSAGLWSQSAYLKASNTGAGDWFGSSVAVGSSTVAVGASRESGSSVGVDGNQASNSASGSGAVYGFALPELAPAEIMVEENGGGELVDGVSVVDFAPAATGIPVAMHLLVNNTGDLPLDISDVVIGGVDAGYFSIDADVVPASVPGGSRGVLRILFSSPEAGDFGADLEIHSNDVDESPFHLVLAASSRSAASLYATWASEAGLEPGEDGLDDIPHADGVANLLKYASNLEGASADRRMLGVDLGLPVFSVAGAGAQRVLRVEFLRRKGSGLMYTPMVSDDLTPGSFMPMSGTETVTDLDAQWERIRVDQPRDPAIHPTGFGIVEVGMP